MELDDINQAPTICLQFVRIILLVTIYNSLIFMFNILEYSDDSDYKDFEFYEEVPDAVPRGRRCDVCPEMHDNVDLSFKIIDEVPKKERAHDVQLDWYKPQRIYRYTKHRIPGYDYEEIDHVFARNPQQCDEKSIWAHCVCRFTCTEPDVVDCYSPCRSGCECKEEYVFDEKTNRCMLPEECPKDEDYIDV
ncbi:uncharacterized protein LOC117227537 isoform X2 [Megalopta genalis]|uniref:uncharacterized protein LOC117227537 isoform X2 n=1 Tax=Megalopta genalis TaxID=115081 RepID=UPI003FD4C8B4